MHVPGWLNQDKRGDKDICKGVNSKNRTGNSEFQGAKHQLKRERGTAEAAESNSARHSWASSGGDSALVVESMPQSLRPGLTDLCAFTTRTPRSPRWTPVALIAWAPFGILLAAVRISALLFAGSFLAMMPAAITAGRLGSVAVRALTIIWGITVQFKSSSGDSMKQVAAARLIVANHISQIDAVPLRACCPISVIVRETYRHWLVRWMFR